MEILREQAGFIASQRKFTLDMFQEFDVSHLPRVSSPLDPALKLQADDGEYLQNPTLFRHVVGKLNYLTNTRPDLSFAVLTLSQYMQKPCVSHLSTALRVLKYVSSDPGKGILLDSRRSVSGFFITLGGAPISWKSKKQISISLSSAEAEYRSMRRVTAELTWLVRILEDLSAPITLPIPLHSDSKAAIHIARNPVFHERTKYVEIDCHFVRKQFLSGLITLSFVPSKAQLADIFTKPLSGVSHRDILGKLGGTKFPSNLRGDVEKKKPPHNSDFHGGSSRDREEDEMKKKKQT
ncbi:PREDICTED: uncharacterized protein LOC109216853 [Nicotiana attenuata]|uniref:uncharacterized protein LOC109216853 n=1 Tax=Nicotiana attenuata TaxID=49451 RepID=UPI000905499C|nr:PREDICTED: uncharacterized protein LOC109216853 [Nicotiana attenuata]